MASTIMSRLPRAVQGFANILQFRLLQSHTATTSLATRSVAVEGSRHFSSTTVRNDDDGGKLPTKGPSGVSSRNSSLLPTEAVFYHPQHDMYVCWHPEVPFPYEMSKPIPMEAHGTESSLKIQSLEPVREVFRKKDMRLVQRELMQLTYTAKYGWRGRHGRKLKYVRADMAPMKQKRDRPFL